MMYRVERACRFRVLTRTSEGFLQATYYPPKGCTLQVLHEILADSIWVFFDGEL